MKFTSIYNLILITAQTDALCEDLASLTCDISIKEKLVEELEASQKRLHAMKQQYEEKLISLTSRIKETEQERDKVLSSIGGYLMIFSMYVSHFMWTTLLS